MTQGQARTTGALYQKVTVGGKEYIMRPLTVGDLAEQEAFIVNRRLDPTQWAADACKLAPDNQHKVIWEIAMEKAIRGRTVTENEAEDFRRSPIGVAWLFWASARRDHPELKTPEDALAVLDSADDDELTHFNAQASLASGEADLGNSTGQTEKEAPAPDLAAGQ